MTQFLNTQDAGFEGDFTHLLGMKREDSPDVDAVVASIIEDVRKRGDAAVIELTAKFDKLELTPETLAFSEAEIEAYCAEVTPGDRAALELAAERIRAVRSVPGRPRTDPVHLSSDDCRQRPRRLAVLINHPSRRARRRTCPGS